MSSFGLFLLVCEIIITFTSILAVPWMTTTPAPPTSGPVTPTANTVWPFWMQPGDSKAIRQHDNITQFIPPATKIIAHFTWFPLESPTTPKPTLSPPRTTTSVGIKPVAPQRKPKFRMLIPPLKPTTTPEPSTTKSPHSRPIGPGFYPPDQVWANITTSRYPCIRVDDPLDFCRRRYRGYYQHPVDCTYYSVCEWGFLHLCRCPEHTHWDKILLTCVWEYASTCVTGQNGKPVIPNIHLQIDRTSSFPKSPEKQIVTWKPLLVTSSEEITTPMTTDFIPQQIRLRALPATPSWLRELTEKTFLTRREPEAPQYQSLMTRFFKPVPVPPLQPSRLN